MAGIAGTMAAYIHARQSGKFQSTKQLAAKGILTGLGAAFGVNMAAAQQAYTKEPPVSTIPKTPVSMVPSAESLAPLLPDVSESPSTEDMRIYNEIARLQSLAAFLQEDCYQSGNTGKACQHIETLNARMNWRQSSTGTQIIQQGASIDWDMAGSWWEDVRGG